MSDRYIVRYWQWTNTWVIQDTRTGLREPAKDGAGSWMSKSKAVAQRHADRLNEDGAAE